MKIRDLSSTVRIIDYCDYIVVERFVDGAWTKPWIRSCESPNARVDAEAKANEFVLEDLKPSV
jgi:hypothetical protein